MYFAFEVIVLEQGDSTELKDSICTGIPVVVSPGKDAGGGASGAEDSSPESGDVSADFASVVREVEGMLKRTV